MTNKRSSKENYAKRECETQVKIQLQLSAYPKNLIQNAVKAMKNPETFNNGTHLLAQYEEGLEPENRNRYSPSCSTLQLRTEALEASFSTAEWKQT